MSKIAYVTGGMGGIGTAICRKFHDAGYTVIATVKDKDARPREIKEYRDDAVFAIKQLELKPDGGIAAVLIEPVPLAQLAQRRDDHGSAALCWKKAALTDTDPQDP